jgi:hypothetical protein
MIRPRNPEQWKNPDLALGIEFKIPKNGVNAYTRWLAQAVSYTHVDWDGYGRRVILTCPGAASWIDELSTGPADSERRDIFMAKRVSGQLGVGELVLRWHYGLSVLVNGEHIWSERAGVRRGRQWELNLQSGSW